MAKEVKLFTDTRGTAFAFIPMPKVEGPEAARGQLSTTRGPQAEFKKIAAAQQAKTADRKNI